MSPVEIKLVVDDESLHAVVRQCLEESISIVDDNLLGNVSIPMYSFDKKEEEKELRKLRKALVRVHRWYSVPGKETL